MAFEFLGGELRCGRPWHPYGVEFALGNCEEEGQALNRFLEVPLGGNPPTDPVAEYDPVGWPTFNYWPRNRTLTHEQFYWRWLERGPRGRPAPDDQPAGRQHGPVPAVPGEEEQLQRDGRRAPAGPAAVRAAGLRRRPGRRSR
jgi:hypothetical protein